MLHALAEGADSHHARLACEPDLIFDEKESREMSKSPPDRSASESLAGPSPSIKRFLHEAATALGRGQIDQAERSLTAALALASGCVEAMRLMGIVSQMRGHFAVARDYFQQAVAAAPDNGMLQMNLGSALCESGDFDSGVLHLQRACELDPERTSPWYNLGLALKKDLQARAALAPLQRSLALDPANLPARISLADTHVSLGEIPEAVGQYRDILRREPGNANAWFELANLKTVPLTKGDVTALQRVLKNSALTADARIRLGFALAKALEDQHDYGAAFVAVRSANALKRRSVKWDRQRERHATDAIMHAFAMPQPTPVDPALGHEIIFIVSLPRSGSTLVEQILASHSQVTGANEITDLPAILDYESKRTGSAFPAWTMAATAENWARLGNEYLRRTRRWREERPCSTDKNLINWKFVGAVARMLPGARFVDCHRDPLETCLACYRQLFGNGALFSYDLQDMASCWRDYRRLMQFWQQQLPDRILDQSYERLVSDSEQQIRRLLDFCGLPFEPDCLSPHRTPRVVLSTASAAQVRQPLRNDTARSERYGHDLDELRAWLSAESG